MIGEHLGNLVLKIDRETKAQAEKNYIYKDIDVFSDKYAVGKIDLETDVAAVKAAVKNIFVWNQGEEILYPGFGNNLRKFLYQPLDDTMRDQIGQEIKRCIEDNEKRVKVESVAIDASEDNKERSIIRFRLKYHVIGSKGPGSNITDLITIEGGNKGTTTVVSGDKK